VAESLQGVEIRQCDGGPWGKTFEPVRTLLVYERERAVDGFGECPELGVGRTDERGVLD